MMRSALTILLLLSLSLYWYAVTGIYCPTPLTYAVGTVDERFNIDQAEAEAAVEAAAQLWAGVGERQLFNRVSLSDQPDVVVNFIFDDRHERALAEAALRESLDTKIDSSADVQASYRALVASYETKRQAHAAAIAAYEADLAAYNEKVAQYNDAGGAPADVFAALTNEQATLAAEVSRLDRAAAELQQIADEVNRLGEQGNRVIRQYNAGVELYNEQFAEPDEFTQGDYRDGEIHIYTFTDTNELITVLAHEFGHALDLPHVEGSASVMYYLMADQPTPPTLSAADTAAFVATCGETGSFETSIRTFIHRHII